MAISEIAKRWLSVGISNQLTTTDWVATIYALTKTRVLKPKFSYLSENKKIFRCARNKSLMCYVKIRKSHMWVIALCDKSVNQHQQPPQMYDPGRRSWLPMPVRVGFAENPVSQDRIEIGVVSEGWGIFTCAEVCYKCKVYTCKVCKVTKEKKLADRHVYSICKCYHKG